MYLTFLDLNKCPLRGPQAGRGARIQEPNQTTDNIVVLCLFSNLIQAATAHCDAHHQRSAVHVKREQNCGGLRLMLQKNYHSCHVVTYNGRYLGMSYIFLNYIQYVFSSAY